MIGTIRNNTKVEIVNCFNSGNISIIREGEYISAGGILGSVGNGSHLNVFNCYNIGNIQNNSNFVYSASGGIIGNVTNAGKNVIISNCYNIGKTTAVRKNSAGGILGGYWYDKYECNIINCFYDETTSDRSVGGSNTEYAKRLTQEQIKGQEDIEINGKNKTLIELLNEYINDDTDNLDTTQWNYWIESKKGYPVFK